MPAYSYLLDVNGDLQLIEDEILDSAGALQTDINDYVLDSAGATQRVWWTTAAGGIPFDPVVNKSTGMEFSSGAKRVFKTTAERVFKS